MPPTILGNRRGRGASSRPESGVTDGGWPASGSRGQSRAEAGEGEDQERRGDRYRRPSPFSRAARGRSTIDQMRL
jgi:hypothetical protein